MNPIIIFTISLLFLIQIITAKPQYGSYNQYGSYPYLGMQGISYNQNQAPTFSNLGGTTTNPLYSALGFNGYSSNGYYNNYNNGYATNPSNQGNQIRIWPFVMGSTSYSNNGYNTPNSYNMGSTSYSNNGYNTPTWYNTNYSYK